MNRERLIEQLEEARARTLHLVEPLTGEDLHRQHDPLMSPIMWDLGHIAHFEELWLVRNLDGPVEFGEMPGIYNPVRASPAGARGTDPPFAGRMPAFDGRDPIARAGAYVEGEFVRRKPAAARWIRLFHGAAARVSAQRDDPADVAAEAGRAVSRAASVLRSRPNRRAGRLAAAANGAVSGRHACS